MDNRLRTFTDDCWEDFFTEARDAVVYLDDSAFECLHWYTGDEGRNRLQNAGVATIRDLRVGTDIQHVEVPMNVNKAVFVYTNIDEEFYRDTLERIIRANRFHTCVVFCSAHNSVFKYISNSEKRNTDSYEALQEDITTWINSRFGQVGTVVEVRVSFLPIFVAVITDDLMVTPPFWDLMPPLILENVDEKFQLKCDHFVSSLHSMFSNFNAKEDIYYIGGLSELIADKLDKLPAAIDRRKRLIATGGISLILVDRTLDLCVATSHDSECLLGKILSTLPRLPRHRNDVAVNMSPLSTVLVNGSSDGRDTRYKAPGCMASRDASMINLFVNNKQKEVLLTLHKFLTETFIVEDSPKAKMTTRITVHSLEKIVNKFRDARDVSTTKKYSKQLQQIVAVIEALKSDKTPQIELMISLEKLILQNLAVSRDSSRILSQISSMIKNRRARGVSMENLLVLLIHLYALAGTDIRLPEQQEIELETILAEAISEDNNEEGKEKVDDSRFTRGRAHEIAKEIVDKLREVSATRNSLKKYNSLIIKPPSPGEVARREGLLQQLIADLINPDCPEIPDLRSKSSSLIAAGFNLLTKGRRNQHPMDNDRVIIYVLGGVTSEEIRITRKLINSRKSNCQLILAGSRIINPSDVTEFLFPSSYKDLKNV